MNFTNMLGLSAAFFAVWSVIRSTFAALFVTVRIRGEHVELLLGKVLERNPWLLSGGTFDRWPPDNAKYFCFLSGAPATVSFSEKEMHAGMSGVAKICTMTFLRWDRKRLQAFVRDLKREVGPASIPVQLAFPYNSEKISEIGFDECANPPYLEKGILDNIIRTADGVFKGERRKDGIILHGDPGCGKSYLIRYLACRYRVPLNVLVPAASWTNTEVYQAFARIQGPSILLLEDFDSIFHQRTPALGDCKFTFDSFLNSFDGNVVRMSRVLIIMTTNYIYNVDSAIRCRPSRFSVVQEIAPPTEEIRMRILHSKETVAASEGFSLDAVLWLRELLMSGKTLDKALLSIPREYRTVAAAQAIPVSSNGLILPGSEKWSEGHVLDTLERSTRESADAMANARAKVCSHLDLLYKIFGRPKP